MSQSDWREGAAHKAMLIHGKLDTWVGARVFHPGSSPVGLPTDIHHWLAELLDFLRADISFFEWFETHIYEPIVKFDINAQSATDDAETIQRRLKRLAERLRDRGLGSDLVREVLSTDHAKSDGVIDGPNQVKGRGEPLSQSELVRIAGLEGPYAMQKPMAQLLAKLRSEPHRWQSVYKLCGGKRGKAHSDAKKNLELLMEKRLAEKQPDGERWRLGAAAFPDKGATKGATI